MTPARIEVFDRKELHVYDDPRGDLCRFWGVYEAACDGCGAALVVVAPTDRAWECLCRRCAGWFCG